MHPSIPPSTFRNTKLWEDTVTSLDTHTTMSFISLIYFRLVLYLSSIHNVASQLFDFIYSILEEFDCLLAVQWAQ